MALNGITATFVWLHIYIHVVRVGKKFKLDTCISPRNLSRYFLLSTSGDFLFSTCGEVYKKINYKKTLLTSLNKIFRVTDKQRSYHCKKQVHGLASIILIHVE